MLLNTSPGSPAGPGSPLTYGALATASGKQKIPISNGVLGCIKLRILRSMLDAIEGNYKILICDRTGAEIISTCLRMHELMEHGVTLVEDLFLDRQPIISSPALYFIASEQSSVTRMLRDWDNKNMYKEAHIFFTGVSNDAVMQTIASHPKLVRRTRSMKDMMLDFAVPETLLFHLNMPADIPKLYPQEIALSGGRENVLGQIGMRLVSVFFTLGGGVPVIRYQGSSRLAQQVAHHFYENVARMAKDVTDFRIGVATPETPLLIIVDRSYDAAAPLVHERTYQCMLNDLTPLGGDNHMYEQQYTGRDGVAKMRQAPVDEKDFYWCQYRHRFFTTCMEELPQKLKELLDANPSLVKGMQNLKSGGSGADSSVGLSALGGAVRALPEFQEKQAKLSMHIDICTKLMDIYKQQRLVDVCEVEQDLAAGRKPFKDNFDAVRRLAVDNSVPSSVRLRLLLLLIATTNTREFTEAKRQQLIQESGLTNDANRCSNIDMFVTHQGRIPQPASGEPGSPSATDSASSRTGGFLPRSLRRKRGSVSGTSSPTSPASNNRRALTEDPFKTQAFLLLDAATTGTLSTADYPLINPGVNDMVAASAAVGGRAGGGRTAAGGRAAKRTLRMGLSRVQDGGADAQASRPALGGGATVGMLDMGNEGQISVNNAQRVVLFVMGGATYSEARAAYEVSKKNFREVIVGGTSIIQPDQFVSQLASLR